MRERSPEGFCRHFQQSLILLSLTTDSRRFSALPAFRAYILPLIFRGLIGNHLLLFSVLPFSHFRLFLPIVLVEKLTLSVFRLLLSAFVMFLCSAGDDLTVQPDPRLLLYCGPLPIRRRLWPPATKMILVNALKTSRYLLNCWPKIKMAVRKSWKSLIER